MFSRKRSFQNEFKKCKIFIDDNFFGELGSGESLTFESEQDSVSVFASMDWFKSKKTLLDLSSRNEVELSVKTGVPKLGLFAWLGLTTIQTFFIPKVESELVRIFINAGAVLPPLIYLIGVKLGKFHFLSIEEKK